VDRVPRVHACALPISRFRNVWVNLETTATMLTNRPGAFERAFAALVAHGGPRALSQIFWGTGCMVSHPRPHLEHFVRDFTFSPEIGRASCREVESQRG